MIFLPVNNPTLLFKKHAEDAGFDLFVAEDVVFEPCTTKEVEVGVRTCIPQGYWGLVVPRSSFRKKGFLAQAVIDAYYTGPWKIATTWIAPPTAEPYVLTKGTRFAQLIIIPLPEVQLIARSLDDLRELAAGKRGDSGYGSTGEK